MRCGTSVAGSFSGQFVSSLFLVCKAHRKQGRVQGSREPATQRSVPLSEPSINSHASLSLKCEVISLLFYPLFDSDMP